MRNLDLEAWLWTFYCSPEFIDMSAAEYEKTAQSYATFVGLSDVSGKGRSDQVYDSYASIARDLRRAADLARMGHFDLARDIATGARSDAKGMLDQPVRAWMSDSQYEAYRRQASKAGNCIAVLERIFFNGVIGGTYFLQGDQFRDRDDGYPGDDVVVQFRLCTGPDGGMSWAIPNPIPHFEIDTTRSCRTGENVPWTGVWYPSTGLERHGLTFAIAGKPMQPAFFVEKTTAELSAETGKWESWPVTRAVETDWHPLVQSLSPTLGGALGASQSPALRAYPGEACPRSGNWLVVHTPDSSRTFREGERMPDLHSRIGSTVWTFVGS